jgi:hypothetical protein
MDEMLDTKMFNYRNLVITWEFFLFIAIVLINYWKHLLKFLTVKKKQFFSIGFRKNVVASKKNNYIKSLYMMKRFFSGVHAYVNGADSLTNCHEDNTMAKWKRTNNDLQNMNIK